MKEVRCDHAEECSRVEAAVFGDRAQWCHAGNPHPVNESCERSYCMEVRRQVQCEPVPVTSPPETCTRRTRDLCDLSGLPCAIVYDGVSCRRGRPPSAAEVADADAEEHRYEDARQVWAESQGADDLGELRALAHDRDIAQRSVWHAFGHRTYRGIPVVKSDYLVPEAPDTSADDLIVEPGGTIKQTATMTAAVWESEAHTAIFGELCRGMEAGTMSQIARTLYAAHDIATKATARIMKLPRIRQEGGE